MRTPTVFQLVGFGLGLITALPSPGASTKEIEAVYRPFRVETGAISPDGERVAFAMHGEKGLELHIYWTARPGGEVVVGLERGRTVGVRLIQWASADQIITVSTTGLVAVTPAVGGTPKYIDALKLIPPPADPTKAPKEPRYQLAPDDPACLLIEFLYPDDQNDGTAATDSEADGSLDATVSTDDDVQELTTDAVAASANGEGGLVTGKIGRPMILRLYRLNVLTGQSKRVLDYDVETATKPGTLIVDRKGDGRIVPRPGAESPMYVYRTKWNEMSALRKVGEALIGDNGWRNLYNLPKDPKAFRFSLPTEDLLEERGIPMAFDTNPDQMIYASNVGRDVYGLYEANMRTGERMPLAVEVPGIDLVDPLGSGEESPLIFDRYRGDLVGVRLRDLMKGTRWIDAQLGAVQTEIEKKFPSREVQVLGWDESRTRFLTLVGGFSDPGRYFVYNRTTGRATEYLKRAPTVTLAESNPTEGFAFVSPAGIRITGYLTLPRNPVEKKTPGLVMAMHDGPWQRVEPGYDRDAQALATMGFIVVKINYRGSAGFGNAHRDAIRTALDTGPLDDAVATLEWLRKEKHIDTRRAGLLGEGYGGYLALRGLQLHPEVFHAAVAINALTDPLNLYTSYQQSTRMASAGGGGGGGGGGSVGARKRKPGEAEAYWLVQKQSGRNGMNVSRQVELLTQPVFFLHDPDSKTALYDNVDSLRSSLKRRKLAPEWMELSSDFGVMGSSERVDAYHRIGEFLNLTLYNFTVKVGDEKVVGDK